MVLAISVGFSLRDVAVVVAGLQTRAFSLRSRGPSFRVPPERVAAGAFTQSVVMLSICANHPSFSAPPCTGACSGGSSDPFSRLKPWKGGGRL